jgi:uncharacterized protein YdeI (YjbR/CyaY-like superfamily)
MPQSLTFETRASFRQWLEQNSQTSAGIWIIFRKKTKRPDLNHPEALEDALCYGWIDGQIQKIDADAYQVYFARRSSGSRWSEKNRLLAVRMEQEGKMTELGRAAIEQAKQKGTWDQPAPAKISEEQVEILVRVLAENEQALTHFLAMSPSVRRTYTGLYLEAKTDETRRKRLDKIIDRLVHNQKPM